MSDSFVPRIRVDGPSNPSLFTFPGSGRKRGNHAGERTGYVHPVYNASPTQSFISFDPQGNVVSPNGWSGNTTVQVQGPWTAAQSDLPPFSPPPHWPPTPSYDGGHSLLHSNYGAGPDAHPLIPQVAMPTLTGQPQYMAHLMDAHAGHHDPLMGRANDNYTIGPPRGMPSSFISAPIARTPLGAYVPSPLLDLNPKSTIGLSPHRSTTLPNILPSDYALNLAPSASPKQYPCRVHQASSYHPISFPARSQSQSQPTTTISPAQPYTSTIPLSAIELPPMFHVVSDGSQVPFFHCHWAGCGIWITCDRDAIKRHLTHAHAVVLKGSVPPSSSSSDGDLSDTVRCEWTDCSSTMQRNGLVRHIHTHLRLKWLCSVCKAEYTRQDSVGSHARKEEKCQSARAISHPSAAAYEATMNGDNTVTLTKILQP